MIYCFIVLHHLQTELYALRTFFGCTMRCNYCRRRYADAGCPCYITAVLYQVRVHSVVGIISCRYSRQRVVILIPLIEEVRANTRFCSRCCPCCVSIIRRTRIDIGRNTQYIPVAIFDTTIICRAECTAITVGLVAAVDRT